VANRHDLLEESLEEAVHHPERRQGITVWTLESAQVAARLS
jgi:hypothetical protein